MADNFTATPGHADGGAECIVHDKAIVALVNNPLWICLAICCRTRRFNGNWQSQQIARRGGSAQFSHTCGKRKALPLQANAATEQGR